MSTGLSGPDPTALIKTGVTADGLTATVSQPAATVAHGASVVYTLTLTNTTGQPYTFSSPMGNPAAKPILVSGMEVRDSSGNLLPTGPFATSNVVLASFPVTLQPGESITQVEPAIMYTQPDRYQVTGIFFSGNNNGGPTRVGPLITSVH